MKRFAECKPKISEEWSNKSSSSQQSKYDNRSLLPRRYLVLSLRDMRQIDYYYQNTECLPVFWVYIPIWYINIQQPRQLDVEESRRLFFLGCAIILLKSKIFHISKVRKSSQNRTQTCCLPLTPDIQSLLQRNSAFFLSSSY